MLFKAQRGFLHFVLTLVIIALTCVYGTGNYFVYVTSKAFKSVTNLTSKVSNTLTVRTLEGRAQSEKDLDGACLGYFTSMDSSDLSKLTDSLSKDNVSFTAKAYDDIYDMVQDLYDGYIDGILFNESYSGVVTAVEEYSMFVNRTTPVYSMTYYTENQNQKQDSINDVDVTSVPFTVMISGNDSYGQFNENSRSDMNMLVTVNPNTGTVLMTSIPRDYYVPIAGLTNGYDDAELEDKLTHSGLYGIETTQKTIENLLDVDINYYIRVNFSSLINLVDAIGGIDVYVEEGLAVDAFYADTTLGGVSEGWNHLDGQRALAFARER
ncbi:MAG: LCP family protein, partial [Floccifex porci]|uniref:LCP family protein n=1 Tax=Floccifex porci TaxID=2606629 RepID=UPI003F03CAED